MKTSYVLRNRRSGRFVRAFNNEWQAQAWVERDPKLTYAAETAHPKDADGYVFDLIRKENAR